MPFVAPAPRIAVETAIRACREKDGDALAGLVLGGAAQADIDAMFALGSDVRLLVFSIPDEAGDVVETTVTLAVQRPTGAEEVERTWELQRTPEGWLFTSLPTCY